MRQHDGSAHHLIRVLRIDPKSHVHFDGLVEFRVDKTGIIHAPVGKIEFTKDQLSENTQTLIDSVLKARPAALKGRYVKRITVASTMSPGIDLDLVALDAK